MKVFCEKYPQLEVHDLGIKFIRGEAEVDETTAVTLVAMDGFGIRADGEVACKSIGRSEEMSSLKAEADALKIKYHPNIGAEKLREKIAEAKAAKENQ